MEKKKLIKAWVLACRPKTLAAGGSPVLIGTALAYYFDGFVFIPALLCLLFAVFSQIAANLINDYYDYMRGTDGTDRIGPDRAVAKGWIKPKGMLKGTIIAIIVACLCGIGLIWYGGPWMIVVGLVCVAGIILYTPLAYHGMGDLFVLVFFGIVAVDFTYFVQTGGFSFVVLDFGIVTGLLVNNILLINNYRDRENDESNSKKTLVVILGDRFAKEAYIFSGLIAVIACSVFAIIQQRWILILPAAYIFPHLITWGKMLRMKKSKKINVLLGETARNLFIFSILFVFALIFA